MMTISIRAMSLSNRLNDDLLIFGGMCCKVFMAVIHWLSKSVCQCQSPKSIIRGQDGATLRMEWGKGSIRVGPILPSTRWLGWK
jgi:hypothetical protein